MESVNAALVGSLLAGLHDRSLDFLSRFVDHFFDATGMDAPIGDQFFERETGNLPPHRIEAGDDDGVRSVVDDHVDAGRQLERANVPAFATDDASLHFIIRQRDSRYRRLDALLRRNSLDSQRYDFLRFTFGVALGRLTDLADPVGSVG